MSRRNILFVSMVAVWLPLACAPSPKPRPARSLSPSAKVRAEELGKGAVARLRSALMRRVGSAVKKGGLPAAIEVCAGDAQRITARINGELGGQITVKRTSLRVRNPKNAPDAPERRALLKMERLLTQGALPSHVMEREARSTGAVYRLYVPIRTMGLCTKCHGAAAKLAPSVRAILQKRYPGDRATGYRSGDLRGMFSVTIPVSALR